jgi:predicted RNase H-related nuclease YkuK (DUF458 family)
MSRIILYIFLISIAGIVVMSNHYATALTYEPSNFKLDNNPVICAFEPPDDANFPYTDIPGKMLALTEYAFDDWKTKITNGERNSAWDITLIKVMKSQQNTFNASQCNILVSYFPSPSGRINSLEPTGITKYQTNHTADIEIYYNNYGDGYYTNDLGTDEQLSKTLEHEFGHAFGLSHVILSDQELQNINTGAEDMPSIMVPYALLSGIHHYSITPSDISQLKSIYANQGFGVYAQTTSLSTQSSTTHQISITTSKQVYHDGDHIVIIIHVSHLTGTNGILTFTLPANSSQIKSITNQVVLSELQTSITYPNAVNETNSVKGTYKVNFSYDNKTDFTSFQIIGQYSSNVTSQEQTDSSMPTTIPTQSSIPEFPFTIPILLAGIMSILVFYRMKSSFKI